MEQASGLANQLLNIIKQIEQTEIRIGQHDGYYISQGQVNVIKHVIDELNAEEGTYDLESLSLTPTTSVVTEPSDITEITRDKIKELDTAIKNKRALLFAVPASQRSVINEERQKLESERAKLQRLLKQL